MKLLTSISYGLDLVHIKLVQDIVKGGVELIQQCDYLKWRTGACQTREAHNVAARMGGGNKDTSAQNIIITL